MKCPHCTDTTLVMAERQGVEIDYCHQCRGIWLDRGELDKLLDRASAAAATSQPSAQAARPVQGSHQRDFQDSDFHGHKQYGSGRKKSWLHDIFD